MPGQHARLSPSAAHRWLKCAGSIKFDETMPEQSSPAAERGTYLHEQAALRLADEPIDRMEDADCEIIERYAEYVENVRAEREDGVLFIEHQVHLSDDIWGTADCVIVSSRAIDVIDLKTGSARVDATDNPQLMIYALAAMRKFSLPEQWEELDIHMHIVQPSISHYDSHQIRGVDFEQFWLTIQQAAAQVDHDHPPFVAGDHCTYCKGAAVCRARRDVMTRLAIREFELADPIALSISEIAALLPQLKLIEDWVNSVRAYALRQAMDGTALPGHKLVAGRSNREWLDSAQAAAALKSAGMDDSQIWTNELISPTTAEKVLGKNLFKRLSHLVHKPAGKPVLALEDDKRPSLAAQEFDD